MQVPTAAYDFSIRFFHGRFWPNEIAPFNGFTDDALAHGTEPSI